MHVQQSGLIRPLAASPLAQQYAESVRQHRQDEQANGQSNSQAVNKTGKTTSPPTQALANPSNPAALTEAELDSLVGELQTDPSSTQNAQQDPVQALLDAWGTESTEHDLNNDGTVDMFDLLELLAKLSQQAPTDDAPAADPDETPPPAVSEPTQDKTTGRPSEYEQRLEELMKAWGTDDAASDLNGDGIVNVFDLTELINQHLSVQAGSSASSVDVADERSSLTTDVAAEPQTEQQPLTVENLLNAWGESSGQFDLNDDGTVNMFDLLALLDRLSEQPDDQPPTGSVPANQSELAADTTRQRQVREQKLERLADRLTERLHRRGFDAKPPANLDSILDRLQLVPEQQSALKQKILASYPLGSEINTVG